MRLTQEWLHRPRDVDPFSAVWLIVWFVLEPEGFRLPKFIRAILLVKWGKSKRVYQTP